MEQAINAYQGITATDEFKERERLRHYARLNEASAIDDAEERGEKRGKQEEKLDVARNALSQGLSLEVIQSITGLDLETIKSINK